MVGEIGFRSRIGQIAVAGQVTDAFALVGTHSNLDESEGRHFIRYVIAYDSARFKPDAITEIIRRRIFETAEEMGYSAAPLSAFESSNGLVGAKIRDWQEHVAVVGAKSVSSEIWELAGLRSVIVFGGFVRKEVIGSSGGVGFADIAEKIQRRVMDKLFGIESLDDIRELIRKGETERMR